MKRFAAFALLTLSGFAPGDAAAKGVSALVVVGSDGRSIGIEPERAVLSVMLYQPGARLTSSPRSS